MRHLVSGSFPDIGLPCLIILLLACVSCVGMARAESCLENYRRICADQASGNVPVCKDPATISKLREAGATDADIQYLRAYCAHPKPPSFCTDPHFVAELAKYGCKDAPETISPQAQAEVDRAIDKMDSHFYRIQQEDRERRLERKLDDIKAQQDLRENRRN